MSSLKRKTLAHWDAINFLAERRFGNSPVAEEAALAVMEGLRADNWKRVRAFSGKCSFGSFIRSLTAHLLEDFSRKRYGRLRPPLWVKTFGGVWERLFELLCFQRLSVVEAIEYVVQEDISGHQSEVEDKAYHLLAKIPDCGKHQGIEVEYEESSIATGVGNETAAIFEKEEKEELLAAVASLVLGADKTDFSSQVTRKFDDLEIRLQADERLLLRLCYQEEMSVTDAGRMLGLNRFQVHGKMRRLLKRLREEFERVGLAEELEELLSDDNLG